MILKPPAIPRQNVLLLTAISVITIIIILVSIFSLKNGFFGIFPFFYILPIILMAYLSPRFAVYFTVALGWIFLGLVYLYGPVDIQLYAVSSAWFYIFVSVGIVISAFAGQLMHERKYRLIFESSQAGMLTFGIDDQIISETNKEAAAILEFTPEEFKGQNFSSLWFDEENERRFIKKLVGEKHVADIEVAVRRKDRTVIWVLANAALTDEGMVICSLVDITESKRIKDDLIESELRYRTLFDGAGDAIFIHELHGKIYETNLTASKSLGYTKHEFMQMRMQDLDPARKKLFDKASYQKLLSEGHILFESQQTKKDGSIIPVEISSRTTEYFGTAAVISIIRDVSVRTR
jgi:PAS domain S-box-containing protein